jgi:hypothetical protein
MESKLRPSTAVLIFSRSFKAPLMIVRIGTLKYYRKHLGIGSATALMAISMKNFNVLGVTCPIY